MPLLLSLALLAPPKNEESYLGLYLQGQKIGYVASKSAPGKLDGQAVSRSVSRTVMSMAMLGSAMTMTMDSSTWSVKGRPLRMTYRQESAGRVQTMDARFVGTKVRIVMDNSGQKTQKVLPLPDGPVVDDPVALVQTSGLKAKKFYILDPMTAVFIPNTVRLVGPATADLRGRKVAATLAEIVDPRMNTKVYVDAKGGFVKAEAPPGIEMIPEPKALAMKRDPKGGAGVDLASATSLKVLGGLDDPSTLTGLTLRITGRDLSTVPSDAHQTVKRDGDAWTVEVHPAQGDPKTSIYAARQAKPEWAKPGLNVPSGNPQFAKVAREVVGKRTAVMAAADAVHDWVYAQMRPNAGIGNVRDAAEVLRTKEGVCRDYAVLTAAVLRAAGVPTRLASGLKSMDGTFYYHAWCEVWDGARWVGVDSTVPERRLSADHVKLADGSVESAFNFPFLGSAKVEAVATKRD